MISKSNPSRLFLYFLGGIILTFSLYSGGTIAQTGLQARPASTICVKISSDTLFKNVKLSPGQDSIECITVTNCGDSLVTVFPALTSSDYDIPNLSTHRLMPDSSCTICVTYQPQTLGDKTDSIVVLPGGIIRLLGTTPCAHVFATPDTVEFGPVAVFSSSEDTILLTNDGDFPFVPNGLYPGGFAFRALGFNIDTIRPHQSMPLILAYHPIRTGKDSVLFHYETSGQCSNMISFYVRGEGVVDGVRTTGSKDLFLDQNYPNPFTTETSFEYTTSSEEDIRLTLNDMNGRVLKTITKGRVSEGKHRVYLSLPDLPSGTYFLLLESGITKSMRELTLLK